MTKLAIYSHVSGHKNTKMQYLESLIGDYLACEKTGKKNGQGVYILRRGDGTYPACDLLRKIESEDPADAPMIVLKAVDQRGDQGHRASADVCSEELNGLLELAVRLKNSAYKKGSKVPIGGYVELMEDDLQSLDQDSELVGAIKYILEELKKPSIVDDRAQDFKLISAAAAIVQLCEDLSQRRL